ncbi:hypothetical protein BC777_1528 [Yoonia maricola]|uniref:Aa3 type cytochrome c oxidase subunit IV n=1 Tax=Yoonia maricola TaxID=420999 RepID=A0A2M8WP09_9RHOB|nr:hypothetical protein [Yoonia maricola]PJI92669.1 hypothetical protein BC777_1528 [Yoonia maricola]
MYEDRNLPHAESTAGNIALSGVSQSAERDKDWHDNVNTLVMRNVMLWGSVFVSCGLIYLLVKLVA